MTGAADADSTVPVDISPNRVRYNDWRKLDTPALEAFAPTIPVSVVVPTFDAPDELARTLAALERQTYPRHLMEVVIVDDGSEPPLEPLQSPLDIRIVRREGRGFSLAAARNAGTEAAAHPILVYFDGDILPDSGFLAAHARWHHSVSDAVTVSWPRYVDVPDDPAAIRNRPGSLEAHFAGRATDASWMDAFVRQTSGLTTHHDQLFGAVNGIFGIRRAFFEFVGGFDETFIRYGFEDNEFGYRAHACGALVVPVAEAPVWHQGRWHRIRTPEKSRDIELQRQKIAHLIPHPDFRSPASGRFFSVPRHVVTLRAGSELHQEIARDAEILLADPASDLAIRIELDPESGDDGKLWLEERFGPDPRVVVAAGNNALDDFPFAAFHVSVPAGACEPALVARLRAALGTGAVARMALPGTGDATITRGWALHRARRTGLPVGHFGDVVTVASGSAADPVGDGHA